jgi:hypothetical protein
MNADQLFSLANMAVLPGWLALALWPLWKWADRFIVSVVVTLLAVLYVYLLATSFRPADFSSFGSLDGISKLFGNKRLLLAGWVHYLAFDLLTGLFIVRNARRHSIPHLVALLCAFGAFMMGPAGLLLYLLIRLVKTRQYFASND